MKQNISFHVSISMFYVVLQMHCVQVTNSLEEMVETLKRVTLVDLAIYVFVRLVTRGRYTPCHSQFNDLSQF